MKMIKNALMASAMVLLSSQVFAFDTAETTEVIKTAQVSSKAVAYEVALDKLETLQNSSAVELNKELGYITHYTDSVSLNDNPYITVSEKMSTDGDMLYTGLINLSVNYGIDNDSND